jgi:hypothetical protein
MFIVAAFSRSLKCVLSFRVCGSAEFIAAPPT